VIPSCFKPRTLAVDDLPAAELVVTTVAALTVGPTNSVVAKPRTLYVLTPAVAAALVAAALVAAALVAAALVAAALVAAALVAAAAAAAAAVVAVGLTVKPRTLSGRTDTACGTTEAAAAGVAALNPAPPHAGRAAAARMTQKRARIERMYCLLALAWLSVRVGTQYLVSARLG
jgi:hypothetical protein